MGSNQLSGSIPPELGQLSNLSSLNLGHNQLTGPVPRELGNLSGLSYFNLSSNLLTGEVPASLHQFTKLQDFEIGSNEGLCVSPEVYQARLSEGLILKGAVCQDPSMVDRPVGPPTPVPGIIVDRRALVAFLREVQNSKKPPNPEEVAGTLPAASCALPPV